MALKNDGLCECGCGLKTNMSKFTSARLGLKKGAPNRFVVGHFRRLHMKSKFVSKTGYVMIRVPGHPRGGKGGWVFEHIVIAEKSLWRHLPKGAVVHHVNGDKSDNRTNNLAVFPTNTYHHGVHYRLKVLRAGGNPFTDRICITCLAPKNISEFYPSQLAVCRECVKVAAKENYKSRMSVNG